MTETKKVLEVKDAQNQSSTAIPAEVLSGLPPAAAERLQRFVDSSESFQRRVYGEDPEPRR